MNQVPLNKNELPLVREILTKYKQGYISGLIPGSNITLTPSGCRNKIISSTGDGGGGGIDSVQAGTNIIIDNSDPSNPIINATLSAYQPIDATLTALAGLLTGANKIPYSTGTDTFSQLDLDTDGTLNANSDIKIATQKAVKTYIDNSGIVDADFTLINTFRSLYNY